MRQELILLLYIFLGGYILMFSLGWGIVGHYAGKIIQSTGLV